MGKLNNLLKLIILQFTMNFFKKTFFMCFTLTAITILLSFIPKQIIRKIHGYCMGFTTGTMSAILFASLIPELLANAGTTNYQNNDSWSTKFEVKKHKVNQILTILIFLGVTFKLLFECKIIL